MEEEYKNCKALSCACSQYAIGRKETHWTYCAECNHTQNIHKVGKKK